MGGEHPPDTAEDVHVCIQSCLRTVVGQKSSSTIDDDVD